MSLGHGNARIVDAATKQLSRLALAAPTMATSDRSLELARELLALLPPQYTTLKWGSGGSEAVEAAIKMARQFHRQAGDPRKYKVLSHYRAYHGVTGHALAASGWRASRSPYEPLAPGLRPSPHARPVPPALRRRSGGRRCDVRAPGRAGDRARGARDDRSALITEPILMSAGVVIPPDGYLPALRELCDRHDIVLDLRRDHHRLRPHRAPLRGRALLHLARHPRLRQGADRRLRRTLGDRDHRPPRAGVLGTGGQWSSRPATPTPAIPSPARPGSRRSRSCENAIWWRTPPLAANRRWGGCAHSRRASPESATCADRASCSASSSCVTPTTKEPFPAAENVGVKVREAARRKGLLLRASHWMAVLAPPLTTTAEELDELLDIFDEALTRGARPSDRDAAAAPRVTGRSAREIVGRDRADPRRRRRRALDRGPAARRAGGGVRHAALRDLRSSDQGQRPPAARGVRGALAARDAAVRDEGQREPGDPAACSSRKAWEATASGSAS